MSLEEKLELAAAELAAAADRRDFSSASACAARYAELIQQAVRELPRPQAAQHVKAAGHRLETARRKICVARARIADRLRRLHRASGYRLPAEIAVHTWSVRG